LFLASAIRGPDGKNAKMDGQPVLAITGMAFHDLIGTHTQQDLESDKLFMDVAVYNQRIMGPTHVENVAHLACRTALAFRGVAHIAFPTDLQEKEISERLRSKRNVPKHAETDVLTQSAHLPDEADLNRAAEILNRGKRIAILAGQGALHATDEGNPEYGCDLHPIDFSAFAHACGGAGYGVEDPELCGRAMEEFLRSPGPAVLQAEVDPFTPPLPAKVTAEQALHFAESPARGEPNRDKIALTALSDKVRELV
jgi:thiamine pyrophosphate-dependent acetolactate synthase large subunit-like protein